MARFNNKISKHPDDFNLGSIVSKNSKWIERVRSENRINERNRDDIEYSPNISNTLEYFLLALSPNPERLFSKGRDLETVKKVLISVLDLVEEDVLTENEAKSVLQFLVSKFVERRLGCVFQDIFDLKSAPCFSFSGFKGMKE